MCNSKYAKFTSEEILVLEQALKESRTFTKNFMESCGDKVKKETYNYVIEKQKILNKLIEEVMEEL